MRLSEMERAWGGQAKAVLSYPLSLSLRKFAYSQLLSAGSKHKRNDNDVR